MLQSSVKRTPDSLEAGQDPRSRVQDSRLILVGHRIDALTPDYLAPIPGMRFPEESDLDRNPDRLFMNRRYGFGLGFGSLTSEQRVKRHHRQIPFAEIRQDYDDGLAFEFGIPGKPIGCRDSGAARDAGGDSLFL